ncbi:unnamed protein product [Lactuca virosa]|uniref:Shikimate kinase n=1 Tax=Lactuca virosa TaxID=75947 RepID=A0AAU9NIZ1_9ASTR|nr:unnamed protein product [Lactuca virosa]
MEIIQAPAGCFDLLHQKPFHSPSISIRNGISSLSLASIKTSPISLNNSRKLLTASCSLLDDAVSGSAVQTFEVDPMLDIKKKAMVVSPGLKGTSIYLVGINSTMKTRLGNLLAEALRYYYFDSDNLVMEAAGGEAAVKQLLDMDKVGLRESETEVLRQLSSMGRLVVSAGDGAVQSSTNLSLLRHGISIWVDVPLDLVAKEIVEGGVRLFGSDISPTASHSEVLSQVAMLYKQMQEGYAIADVTISLQKVAGGLGYEDVESVSAEDMGMEVLTEIEKLIRVKKMMEDAARPF